MKRLIHMAARLYPAWWRKRYATEFEALLDDVQPGWRNLFDVINGALTMQIRVIGIIPVICGLVGALVGGLVATRTPEVYVSSATIRLNAPEIAHAEPATGRGLHLDLQGTLEKALRDLPGAKASTSVELLSPNSGQTTLRLTSAHRDPVQAQSVAEKLTAAVATSQSAGARSAQVLDSPDLPTSPIGPDYLTLIASGGALGLTAGGLVVLLVRSRRRAEC